eukprot:SAG22_NODE_4452_length_1263_cov_1.823883_2_plen_113_part_00
MISQPADSRAPFQSVVEFLLTDTARACRTDGPGRTTRLDPVARIVIQHLEACGFERSLRHDAATGSLCRLVVLKTGAESKALLRAAERVFARSLQALEDGAAVRYERETKQR